MTSTDNVLRRPLARLFAALTLAAALIQVQATATADERLTLIGAGASFPAPLYLRWFRDFHRAHPEIRPDYQAIGSGAGVAGFIDGRLDFAGSDIRLTPEQTARTGPGVAQLPMTAGAVVLAYNLPGITSLNLSREALSGIFNGRIERWNDAAIAAANPGLNLPDEPITLVARNDASGTTHVMTRYLSAFDPQFAESVGATMTPVWPDAVRERGALIRGRGNDGVAAYVQAIPGAIGYVQYAYAKLTGARTATLQNKAGTYVTPGAKGFGASLQDILSATENDLAGELADPGGVDAYPILSMTWLIVRKDYQDPEKGAALHELIRYCMTDGQAQSEQLGYIPADKAARELFLGYLKRAFGPGKD